MKGILSWGLMKMVASKGKERARGTGAKTSTRKVKNPEATPAPKRQPTARDRHRGRA